MSSPLRAAVAEIDAYLSRLPGHSIGEVRDGIAKWISGPIKEVRCRAVPACGHLPAALADLRRSGEASLAAAIDAAAPLLRWVTYDAYPRAEIGEAFADGHAFASLIGEGGAFAAGDFDLGLFVIGPGILYRDHHHAAPELYAPLTGTHGWRFGPGGALTWKPAHAPVWNPPWQPHATQVGDVPFLAIYCWTRDVSQPAKVIA